MHSYVQFSITACVTVVVAVHILGQKEFSCFLYPLFGKPALATHTQTYAQVYTTCYMAHPRLYAYTKINGVDIWLWLLW